MKRKTPDTLQTSVPLPQVETHATYKETQGFIGNCLVAGNRFALPSDFVSDFSKNQSISVYTNQRDFRGCICHFI